MRSGIDTQYVLDDVRAEDDLFLHVNGRWLDDVPIPDDRASNGTFYLLRDLSEEKLREIVEEAAAGHLDGERTEQAEQGPHAEQGRQAEQARKVGDLYASFMAEDRIEALGTGPITADLDLVDGVADLAGLVRVFGELDRSASGAPFGFYVNGDAKQSDAYIVYLNQGGLSLPDESYYREESHSAVRAAFVEHVERMLRLAGRPDPAGAAATVLALETRLAAHHWDRVSNRDATKTYTKLDAAALAELAPAFDWASWAKAVGAPDGAFDSVVVRQPSFFTGFASLLTELPLADWKVWLGWRQVHGAAPLLTAGLVEENFAFYGRTLTGGSGRWAWSRALSARRSASCTCSGTSPPPPRTGCSSWWRTWSRRTGRASPRCPGWAPTPGSGRWPSSTRSPRRSPTRTAGGTTPACASTGATWSGTRGARPSSSWPVTSASSAGRSTGTSGS